MPSSTIIPPPSTQRYADGWRVIRVKSSTLRRPAKLKRQRLKRGVFQSVVDLQLAIHRFVVDTKADPTPFAWTAGPKRVLTALRTGTKRRASKAISALVAAQRL
jgi:hypothetical protein